MKRKGRAEMGERVFSNYNIEILRDPPSPRSSMRTQHNLAKRLTRAGIIPVHTVLYSHMGSTSHGIGTVPYSHSTALARSRIAACFFRLPPVR